jgi:cytidyltransferase-like protein|tara:strand:- start:560 stop:979 length:420 start_codon:yes stop_codon:yes gene_type:complete
MKKATIVSGYFNPLHRGHLELFEKASEQGDLLIVIVNSDLQRQLKGSKEFQTEDERIAIIRALQLVDIAYISVDKDKTQVETLKMIYTKFGDALKLTFANGGDQNNDTIPERSICEGLNINLVDGLGEKIQSSSWLLEN